MRWCRKRKFLFPLSWRCCCSCLVSLHPDRRADCADHPGVDQHRRGSGLLQRAIAVVNSPGCFGSWSPAPQLWRPVPSDLPAMQDRYRCVLSVGRRVGAAVPARQRWRPNLRHQRVRFRLCLRDAPDRPWVEAFFSGFVAARGRQSHVAGLEWLRDSLMVLPASAASSVRPLR